MRTRNFIETTMKRDSLPVIFNLSYHVWTKKTQYADTS